MRWFFKTGVRRFQLFLMISSDSVGRKNVFSPIFVTWHRFVADFFFKIRALPPLAPSHPTFFSHNVSCWAPKIWFDIFLVHRCVMGCYVIILWSATFRVRYTSILKWNFSGARERERKWGGRKKRDFFSHQGITFFRRGQQNSFGKIWCNTPRHTYRPKQIQHSFLWPLEHFWFENGGVGQEAWGRREPKFWWTFSVSRSQGDIRQKKLAETRFLGRRSLW